MTKTLVLAMLATTIAVAACTTQTQMLDQKQDMAIQTALSRARFDMNCPQATGQVISREMTQPAVQGPLVSGIQRAEYTIGIEGCGKRTTMVIVCPEGGESCFAGEPGGRLLR